MTAISKTSHFIPSPGAPKIEVVRVEANLGAEVRGLDLAAPLSPEAADLLRSLLWEHQVLFFRDAGLDNARQAEIAKLFGEIDVDSIAKRRGATANDITPMNTARGRRPTTAPAGTPTPPTWSVPIRSRSCGAWSPRNSAATPPSPAESRPTRPFRTR